MKVVVGRTSLLVAGSILAIVHPAQGFQFASNVRVGETIPGIAPPTAPPLVPQSPEGGVIPANSEGGAIPPTMDGANGPLRFGRDVRRGRFGVISPLEEREMMIRNDAIRRGRGRFDPYVSDQDMAIRNDAMRRGRSRYNDPYISPMGPTVQGGSLKTWHKGNAGRRYDEKTIVEFGTDGRPLYGNFEVWDGPDNSPSRVNVYSQDGYNYGLRMITGRRNSQYYGGSESYQVRNNGPLEFPMRANIGSVHYEYDSYGGSKSMSSGFGSYVDEIAGRSERRRVIRDNPYVSTPANAKTIQGGSNKCWAIGPRVESVRVELHSQGMPIMARVELLQGPNNVKTLAQVYQQDGHERPFIGILDTPGYNKGSVRIVNDGPLEFPITASVEPHESY